MSSIEEMFSSPDAETRTFAYLLTKEHFFRELEDVLINDRHDTKIYVMNGEKFKLCFRAHYLIISYYKMEYSSYIKTYADKSKDQIIDQLEASLRTILNHVNDLKTE